MPRAVPWPEVAREPVLQCVRTEIGTTAAAPEEDEACCCCWAASQAAPWAPMERFVSRSLARMASAVRMKVSMTAADSGLVAVVVCEGEGVRIADLRWLMALVRSTAVGRDSLR